MSMVPETSSSQAAPGQRLNLYTEWSVAIEAANNDEAGHTDRSLQGVQPFATAIFISPFVEQIGLDFLGTATAIAFMACGPSIGPSMAFHGWWDSHVRANHVHKVTNPSCS